MVEVECKKIDQKAILTIPSRRLRRRQQEGIAGKETAKTAALSCWAEDVLFLKVKRKGKKKKRDASRGRQGENLVPGGRGSRWGRSWPFLERPYVPGSEN